MKKTKTSCSENWRLVTAPAALPGPREDRLKLAPRHLSTCKGGTRLEGDGTGADPCCGRLPPARRCGRGGGSNLALLWGKEEPWPCRAREGNPPPELLRRGLRASPFLSCPLDGPCCYLVHKYTRKGMEQSNRIKIYFEMT